MTVGYTTEDLTLHLQFLD